MRIANSASVKQSDDHPKEEALLPWDSYTDMNTVLSNAKLKHCVQLYTSNTGWSKANMCSGWLELVFDPDFRFHIAPS